MKKKEPKTIKGYISLLKFLEQINPAEMKGFDKLSKEKQEELMTNWCEFSNIINELDYE